MLKKIYIVLLYFLFDRSLQFILHADMLNTLYKWLSRGFAVIILIQLLVRICHKRHRLSSLFCLILIFLSLFISTYIHDGSLHNLGTMAYPVIGMCILSIISCYNFSDAKQIIHGISTLYFILAVINLFFLILSPNFFADPESSFDQYFLGIENQIGYTLMTGLYFALLDNYINGDRQKLVFYLFIQVITILYIFSGSNVVGLATMLLCLYLASIKKFLIKHKVSHMVMIMSCIFTLIFFMGNLLEILEQPVVTYIIEDVLGKDVTLTNRIFAWAEAMYGYLQSPIFGWGVGETGDLFLVGNVYISAHNQILQNLYEGGLLFFISMIPLIVLFSNATQKLNTNLALVSKACFISIVVMYMAEAPGIDKLLNIMIWSVAFSNIKELTVISEKKGIQ